jgi:hypothetical protein
MVGLGPAAPSGCEAYQGGVPLQHLVPDWVRLPLPQRLDRLLVQPYRHGSGTLKSEET